MQLFTTIAGLRCYLDQSRPGYPRAVPPGDDAAIAGPLPEIGLVPTMGALHPGHLSLIERASQENQIVVVSIFVNPLQFGPQEDFAQYPRTLEADRQQCEQAGVDVIFAPTPATLGLNTPVQLTQVVPPVAMTQGLCGRSRPGHFQGVATIVTKLLSLVQPQRAYFGEKDAQQLAIIRRLVADLNLPVEIVGCPIAREPDGLAYSSRNVYLSPAERQQAPRLYQSLQAAQQAFQQGQRDSQALISQVKAALAESPAIAPEYVELVHPDTLDPLPTVAQRGLLAIAARLGETRLIDNVCLEQRQPIVAIDGPAGAGKSTVARRVAQTLNLLYLDTGAMYRAITWLVLQADLAVTDAPAVAELASQCQIQLSGTPTALQVAINGRDVTTAIRSAAVTAQVSTIAAQPAVRAELVRQQRKYGQTGGIVMEGRDIGTYVFPRAEVKIFLTASVQERARRRQQDLQAMGQPTGSLEALEQTIYERDRQDSTRALAPLRQAADAIEIQTDGLTIDAVVARIVELYHIRQAM